MSVDVSTLTRFASSLRKLPTTLAQRVAAKAAPVITAFANDTFGASQDPYGVPWAPGHDGARVTLHHTGALARHIKYVAIGTRLRVELGVKYAKYQVGKRLVFPRFGLLPPKYADALRDLTQREVRDWLAQNGGRS